MRHLQNVESRVIIKQQGATNGATLTSDSLDIKNAQEVKITVYASTSDAATNNPSVFKLQESDDNVATNFADITKFVGDGTGGFPIPNSPTAVTDKPFAVFNVNPNGRKRYIRLLISPVLGSTNVTQTWTAVAQIKSKIADVGTAEENAAVIVTG